MLHLSVSTDWWAGRDQISNETDKKGRKVTIASALALSFGTLVCVAVLAVLGVSLNYKYYKPSTYQLAKEKNKDMELKARKLAKPNLHNPG